MVLEAKDIPQVQSFMTDFWNFIKCTYIPEESDDWWDKMLKTATKILKKYNDDPMVKSVMLGYLDYIDKKSRGVLEQ